jgi:hypothetical protein
MLIQDWLMVLYSAIRREVGMRQAKEIYREPDEWLRIPIIQSPAKEPEHPSNRTPAS